MSGIVHFIQVGGFVMYPLLALSLVAIAVIVERILAYRQLGGLAPGLLEEVTRLCRVGRYDEAKQLCEARTGPVASCLAVILRHRDWDPQVIERLVQETGQERFIRLERLLPVLDTTTTISPLLGLLGTLVGMIGTFQAISAQQNRGNTDAILAGVGEALYATAAGLTVAIICFVAYNYFTSRLRTITSETEQAATKLLNVIAEERHAVKDQSGAANESQGFPKKEDDRGVQAAART